MKCLKCGSEIKEGHLYCEKCGEEVRIVPDFDATIDENINISFTDDIDTAGVIDELSKVATKDINKEINSEIDKSATKEIKDIKTKVDNIKLVDEIKSDNKPGDKSIMKALVVAGAICVVILVVVLSVFINGKVNSYYSIDNQYEKAFELYENGNYAESIKVLKHAESVDNNDTRIKTLIADNYYMMEKYDESNAVLYDLADKFSGDPYIYEKIILNSEAKGDYQAINQLLKDIDDETLTDTYSQYLADDVDFSLQEGTYDTNQDIELKTANDSKIYYYLTENNSANKKDNDEEDSDELEQKPIEYTGPIEIGDGSFTIKAFSVNKYGIKSDIVSKDYIVDFNIPDAPIIKTKSAVYNVPVPVEIVIPDYELCYYTIDGDDPTPEDELYKGPIPMHIGKHTYKFAVISSKGTSSEVVTLETTLDLIVLIDMDMAKNAIINYKAAKGSSDYTYKCEQAFVYNNETYYIINEYSESNDGLVQTGNHYAVDVLNGMSFRAILNESTGQFTLEALI